MRISAILANRIGIGIGIGNLILRRLQEWRSPRSGRYRRPHSGRAYALAGALRRGRRPPEAPSEGESSRRWEAKRSTVRACFA